MLLHADSGWFLDPSGCLVTDIGWYWVPPRIDRSPKPLLGIGVHDVSFLYCLCCLKCSLPGDHSRLNPANHATDQSHFTPPNKILQQSSPDSSWLWSWISLRLWWNLCQEGPPDGRNFLEKWPLSMEIQRRSTRFHSFHSSSSIWCCSSCFLDLDRWSRSLYWTTMFYLIVVFRLCVIFLTCKMCIMIV